jgi:hypothetical protein
MPIQYALYENHITSDPNDYSATVLITGSADGDDLVQDILDEGCTVTKPDILAVTAALMQALERRLEMGQRVNYFGMSDYFPRAKGKFNGPLDPWADDRHHIDVGANVGSKLRDAVRKNATVERVKATKPAPELIQYHDFTSDTNNDSVSVGGPGQLAGSRLKFNTAKADEGIYFVPATGAATKVTMVTYNKPGRLDFTVPATLVPGTYHLEVRARQGTPPKGTDNRELRVGRLDATLTV